MIELTAPDGSTVSIDGKQVIRVRPTLYAEKGEGNTRIDWAIMSIVKEQIEEVVPLVKAELPSLAVLTAKEEKKVWFDAIQAVGPLAIIPSQRASGFNSSIKIMGYRQYVIETPEMVRAVISAGGGTPI
jgi:hypothetical protein